MPKELKGEELYILRMLHSNLQRIKQELVNGQVAYQSYFIGLQKKYGDGRPISIDIGSGEITLEEKKAKE